ncbi:NfeD family protein [Nodosilinea sp. LEGE 07088]|uniref:NfeD family protein n=1 Tax=Nodosilinea sp. LEGE 07088 TaxID=2777968 RepID=UPI00187F92A2|nr:NfeD family protein [Nodosilinea sp. LEGE 07088]MBE9135744.1 NfeD family protein [Nodosilinea sp. LEGE 07088]
MNRSTPFPDHDFSTCQGRGTVNRLVTTQHPGRVYFQATYWPARLSQTATPSELQPGDPVEVVGRDGLTLLVKPLPERRASS